MLLKILLKTSLNLSSMKADRYGNNGYGSNTVYNSI